MEEQELYGTEQRKPYFCQPPDGCGRWLFDIYRSDGGDWHACFYGIPVYSIKGACPSCGRAFEFGALNITGDIIERIEKFEGGTLGIDPNS